MFRAMFLKSTFVSESLAKTLRNANRRKERHSRGKAEVTGINKINSQAGQNTFPQRTTLEAQYLHFRMKDKGVTFPLRASPAPPFTPADAEDSPHGQGPRNERGQPWPARPRPSPQPLGWALSQPSAPRACDGPRGHVGGRLLPRPRLTLQSTDGGALSPSKWAGT